VSGATDLNEAYQLSTPWTARPTGGLAKSLARSRNAYPYFANLFSHHRTPVRKFYRSDYYPDAGGKLWGASLPQDGIRRRGRPMWQWCGPRVGV